MRSVSQVRGLLLGLPPPQGKIKIRIDEDRWGGSLKTSEGFVWVDLKFRLVSTGGNLPGELTYTNNTSNAQIRISPLGYNLYITRGTGYTRREEEGEQWRRSGGRLLYFTHTFVRVPSEHVYGGEKGREGENLDRSRPARVPNVPEPLVLKFFLHHHTRQANLSFIYLDHFNNFFVYRKKLFYI